MNCAAEAQSSAALALLSALFRPLETQVHSLSRFPFPIFVLFNRGQKKKSILLEREVQL